MTTALSKPRVKTKVAAKLAKRKQKAPAKKKAARAIPVSRAHPKKVSGRKEKPVAEPKKASIKSAINPRQEKNKASGSTVKHPVKEPVKKEEPVKIRKIHSAAKPTPESGAKTQSKTDNKDMPETTTLESAAADTLEVQISPNLSDKALHDYKLVRSAIDQHNQKAFAELMARYKDSIYFMLLKMVNNRDDAEDLTIEAFGKAFKNIRQYTPDYAFSTWLFKIATNNCIDFIRKKRKQAFSIDRGFENDEGQEMVLEVKSLHPDPEEHYMKKQKVEMMRDVVDKLKPRYKKLVELRYFQELAYEEIAAELNLPLGTVKAQLFRAREFLYQIMKNSAHQI